MNGKTFLDKGELKRGEGHDTKADFHFPSPKDFFSAPANLIPGIGGVSGGRVLLGSKATLQAISLVDRQAPLVRSVSSIDDKAFVETYGKHLMSVTSNVDGTVTHVDSDSITVKDSGGKEHHFDLYNNFTLGRKTFMHHYPKVKVGDHVKKNDVLATSNYTDDHGNLALGTNLRTAVMPYRSGNFEDAWVVTESGAKKLEAEQLIKYRIEKKMGIETSKAKYISLFPNKFFNKQLDTIDQDGAVKVGTVLHHGDPVILAYSPKALKSTDIALGKLSKVLKNAFRDQSQTWHYEHEGTVTDVAKAGDLITVTIKTRRGLAVGDKVSNAWGAKGVVGAIIPDSQAPQDHEGKPVDMILNSMSITSRVAPALAVTIGLGKVAEKLGHPIKFPHFNEKPAVKKAMEELKKHDISDTEKLYDPLTGKHIEVLTGPLYFTRLIHIAEDKESSSSETPGYSWDMQPTRSGEESTKRIGNLSTASLLSHGANSVLRDFALVKATKNDEFWRNLKLGLPAPSPKVPFIFDKFISSLHGAGVKVDKKGDLFNIMPMTDKDVTAMSHGPIENAKTFKAKGDKVLPEAGGLFDPSKVGIYGDKYNHVDLHFSVPNPISEDFLRKMLGTTQKGFEDLVIKGALKDKLSQIDIDKKIKEYEDYLKSGKKTHREDSIKVLSFLRTLKQHNIHPQDLMLTKIPVIPAQFRPQQDQGGMVLTSPVNTLYKELIQNNDALQDTTYLPEELVGNLKRDQYNAVKAVFGLGEPITVKSKEKGVKGLLSTTLGTQGGSAKTTMFQAKVVNKPLNLVGRAVLTPDAKLDLDEAAIPQDTLWKVYKPFVIRRLVMKGVPATKAAEYVKTRNPLASQALMEETRSRPGIISRDPSLHKFNLTGFYLRPNPNPKDKTIKLNPLVFKSFNADNDGDQLNVNIPPTEESRQEVIDKMLPSRNLLSPKTFQPIYTPGNESALGLFQMSTEDKHNSPIKYKSAADVIRDFHNGKLDIGDRVEIE